MNERLALTEDEFRASIAEERRQARVWAKSFADAAAAGNVDRLYEVASAAEEVVDGWCLAMRRIARLSSVSPDTQEAFLGIWIENKHLPLAVGERATMARALRVLMRRGYGGAPLQLFRGTSGRERRCGAYGFSWTTQLSIARDFAALHARMPTGGVLLRTMALPDAILLMREEEDYYDEGEVVVDPFRLGRVQLVERLLDLEPVAKTTAAISNGQV